MRINGPMIKTGFLCLTASIVSTFTVPAWGEMEAAPSTPPDLSKETTTSQPVTTPAADSNPKTTSGPKPPVAKRVLGIVVGTVVGTPVCVVRKTIDEEKYGINGMIGTSNNKKAQVAAGLFWAPFAVFTGAVESPAYAAINSLNATDEPFTKSQFSLSDVKVKVPAKQ